MYKLKTLSRDGVPAALEKAVRYRLLNEPFEAESICLDVLALDENNQEALVTLLLALADQIRHEGGATVKDAEALLPRLSDAYQRHYYAGVICERRAEAYLEKHRAGSGPLAHAWLVKAMGHYERAEDARPAGNDDAILRWNTCARIINRYPHVKPSEPHSPMMLE